MVTVGHHETPDAGTRLRPEESYTFNWGGGVVITRRASLTLLFALGAKAQTAIAQDDQWHRFLLWVDGLSFEELSGLIDPSGSRLRSRYEEKLVKDGLPSARAEELVRAIQQRMTTGSEWSTWLYNKTYAGKRTPFSLSPTAFLVQSVKRMRPGKALDVGMGQGRNAIFLAQQGWDVTGLDLSEVGIQRAQDRAKELGIKINTLVQDVDRFDFGDGAWDLVCILYFSGYPYVHDIEKRVARGLRPGGYAIMESPYGTANSVMEWWSAWKPLGLRLIHLEFDAGKAEWGQHGFQRILAQSPG